MQVHNLSENPSLLTHFLSEIRDKEIQKDPLRFRVNIERIGHIMAYELSKHLDYKTRSVETPLGTAPTSVLDNSLVVATILRAGLPLHHGFLDFFDRAENAFISAYRKVVDDDNFDIHVEYVAAPDLTNKELLLVDPMLATGGSMHLSWQALLNSCGTPRHTHMVAVVASQQAIDFLKDQFTADDSVTLWVAVIDPALNEHAYIVPGLGDAGDLAFGAKL
jgi:uracil phosphoribosyltransferase